MREVLILGAGRVSAPLIRYVRALPDTRVTVADSREGAADVTLDVTDAQALSEAIAGKQLVVSMVPPTFHPMVARPCLDHGAHLVTTSYTSPEIRAFDEEARDKGLLILMECGEDPGIDHMSTKRLIDGIHDEGGTIDAVRMYCGGLIDWAANRNPFHYKFSWSPKGVFLAARADGIYLENGEAIRKPGGPDLFRDPGFVEIPGAGTFETYPNRDNRIYPGLYGIPHVRSFYRGLLRFPGWCSMMRVLGELGFFELEPEEDFRGTTYAGALRRRLGLGDADALRPAIAQRLGLSPDDNALARLAWAGLFDDAPVEIERGALMDALVARLERKLPYEEGERDMILLHHEIDATIDGKKQRHLATLIRTGDPHPGETAMARAVGYPAAIAAELVLEKRTDLTGVHIPMAPEIYGPILDGLAKLGIEFDESVVPA